DPSRLRIVGLLAQRSHTVEELADELGISNSTASHHLKRLAEVGLVGARAEGYYRHYSLQADHLREMASKLLGEDGLPRLADDPDLDLFERKVLKAFTDADGRITAFPVQAKKYRVLIEHVAKAFEPGRRYSEKAINGILERFNGDTVQLRRSLVDLGFMARDGGGGEYWLA
ncbi:MAG TPA: metalloregulator ArsR/SmtB family transcription factor, partial [Trueperaceae bacterium]|nr:metalloregulator ArsR/SmtB family transcription factor [Trueperaceae bacterium]